MNRILDKYNLTRLVSNNITMELLSDKMVRLAGNKTVNLNELFVDTVNANWDEIIELIYEVYPEIRGRVCLIDYISEMIGYANELGVDDTREDIEGVAILVAENIMNFVEGYNNILVDARVRKEDRE